ncbi:MAG: hypothetical protein V4592_18320 [Bacteroidota bacterium]
MHKRILIALVFLCHTAIAQTDTTYRYLSNAKQSAPLVVINSHIIGGLNSVLPGNIDSIHILKSRADMPANLKNLGKYGVILVKLKKKAKIETKSFREIKKWMNINGGAKFAVDGFFVDDENIVVATRAITQIDVIRDKPEDDLADVVINVWTLAPQGRGPLKHGERLPTDKPGVIYIR